jgi:DNA invertase Pin-like site-specific DNA recombinase
MKDVELYAKVRYAIRIEGLSKRAVARQFGIDLRTVDKVLEFSGRRAIGGRSRR